ncbi:hypothetical protein WA026_004395 [Henosepilachna vigintioctopunctata]|uniref:E2 ubiquitin-conjugating enzyme n=1 Tax=Henosepilachna vigintioctopunctata TaxID=420089 RepID=A0AAW1V9X9_9CUCU
MNSMELNKLVQSILKLKDKLLGPREYYTEKQDTFTVCESEEGQNVSDEEPDIDFVNSTCYQCNGYYEPCFGDPVCSTCHLFLYPVGHPLEIPPLGLEENNDSDSGNDEPLEMCRVAVWGEHQRYITLSRYLGLGYRISRGRSPFPHSPQRQNESEQAIAVPTSSDVSNQPNPPRPSPNQDKLDAQLQRLSIPSAVHSGNFNFGFLPPEVLMHTFQFLDEISLWSIGQVSSRWRSILLMYIKPEKWKEIIANRWPLLIIRDMDQDWYELYSAMMKSVCCFKCVQQMAAQECPPIFDNNSWRAHRLRTELRAMRTDPLDGIEAIPLDEECCHWQATMEGPTGSCYEGGLFFLYIQVPVSYPLRPPIVRFLTKIFHPNVSRHGDIGVDSLHQNWSLALTLSKLLISIQSLLTDPFCDVCMEPDICKLYVTNRSAFEEQARKWTVKYAMHDLIPH